MRIIRRTVPGLLLSLALLAGLWPGSARGGEDSAGGAEIPDSLAAADSLADAFEIPPSPGVHPVFKSETRSTDTRMGLKNSLALSMGFPSSWILSSRLHFDRELSRTTNRTSTKRGFTVSSSKRILGRIPVSFSASRKRNLQEQNPGESNYRLDEWDLSTLTASSSGGLQFADWLGMNTSLSSGASTNENRNNQGMNRTTFNGNSNLALRMDLKPLEKLKIVSGVTGGVVNGTGTLLDLQDRVQSRNDSIQLKVNYAPGPKLKLSISGGMLGEMSQRLDFQRDIFNVVLPESIPIKEETYQDSWGGRLDFDLKPGKFLNLSLALSTRSSMKRVTNTTDKDKDNRADGLKLSALLRVLPGQTLDMVYKEDHSEDRSFISDRTTMKREVRFLLSQTLNPGFKLSAEAYFFLNQDFYKNSIKNPLDRDQFKNRYTFTVSGRPISWLKADNTLTYQHQRDIMIRAIKSISNKERTTLAWRSNLEYTFFRHYRLKQMLEVKASKEDFVFTQNLNSLNRESTLLSTATIPLFGAITLNLAHEFKLRQLGSFLPDPDVPGHPETFFRSERKKRELFRFGFSYILFPSLKLSCKEELGREVSYEYADASQELTPYGNLDLGILYNRDFGGGGKVRLELVHKAKFGRFVRKNQRSLWIPSLSIEYNF